MQFGVGLAPATPQRSENMKDHVEQGLAVAGMLVVLVGVMFAAAAALT
jgi:hypothetical protein